MPLSAASAPEHWRLAAAKRIRDTGNSRVVTCLSIKELLVSAGKSAEKSVDKNDKPRNSASFVINSAVNQHPRNWGPTLGRGKRLEELESGVLHRGSALAGRRKIGQFEYWLLTIASPGGQSASICSPHTTTRTTQCAEVVARRF